jgi:geranylgeranylglycerol-phosphate geranylgeranyltransferase
MPSKVEERRMTPPKLHLNILGPYIEITRPLGGIVMGIAVTVGEIAALGYIPPFYDMIIGFGMFFFLMDAAFVFNDYVDIDIDRMNVPQAGVLAFLAAILGLSYILYGKKTGILGNMTVAFCVAIPPVFGGYLAAGSVNVLIVMISLLIFLSSVGGEIVQGIADIQGDRIADVRSVALVHGHQRAAFLACGFFALTALVGPLLFLFVCGGSGIFFIPVILIADVGVIYSSAVLLRNPTEEIALTVRHQVNVWMILGLLAFFVIAISLSLVSDT